MSSPAKQQPIAEAASASVSTAAVPTDPALADVSEGAWSDPSLVATVSSLAVIDEPAALEQCNGEWAFFVELTDDWIAEFFTEKHRELATAIKENQPFLFRRLCHAQVGAALNLHLPALSHLLITMRALGGRMQDTLLKAEPRSDIWTPRPNLQYPPAVVKTLSRCRAWQKRLLSMLHHEFKRLRSAMPPIRTRALMQQQQADMDEALESAVDSRLEAHFQAA